MNMLTPVEIVEAYSKAGKAKARRPWQKIILLSVLAGLLISMSAAATDTAIYAIENVSTARMISGLLFPFGLGIVMLVGAELFTGNVLMVISVAEGQTSLLKMLRNWLLVYGGNMIGALLLAAGCVFFGQLNYSAGELAVFTIKLAAAKCALPFGNALVQGIFCNILVSLGVLCSLSAKDTAGRILGAYIPTAFFVICGFEHCVANMFYIPAGLFALLVPRYAQLAVQAGIDISALNPAGFLVCNLLPVTLGNIIGGVAVGMVMWYCHMKHTIKSGEKLI